MLRGADIPPISGGPGKSRAGGFFTIGYGFLYISLIVALLFQYTFANEHITSSLLQVALQTRPHVMKRNATRVLSHALSHAPSLSPSLSLPLIPATAPTTALIPRAGEHQPL